MKLLCQMLGDAQSEETRKTWQKLCSDFESYVLEFLAGEIWSRGGLPLRIKSLCTVSGLAALGRTQGLELNIRMALKNGATREKIVETFLHLAPYVGFPACWEGLMMAHKIFSEE